MAMPAKVRVIPRKLKSVRCSPRMIQLKKAVTGGARFIINIENLEPISINDLNRNKSPKTNPTSPEIASQNQVSPLALKGNMSFPRIRLKMLKKINPTISLRILTAMDPIFRLADSNDKAVTVQNNAVSRAANSPK
jgi:hypothetical protein